MKRFNVNKKRGARVFKKHVARTKSVNMKAAPMRGGIRL